MSAPLPTATLQQSLAYLKGLGAVRVSEPRGNSVAVVVLPRTLEALAKRADLSLDATLELLGIARRTYARRKAGNLPLAPDEADRVLRMARVMREAERVFGDGVKARIWLNTPYLLFDRAPIALLGTDAGATEVTQALSRIEWGDFA